MKCMGEGRDEMVRECLRNFQDADDATLRRANATLPLSLQRAPTLKPPRPFPHFPAPSTQAPGTSALVNVTGSSKPRSGLWAACLESRGRANPRVLLLLHKAVEKRVHCDGALTPPTILEHEATLRNGVCTLVRAQRRLRRPLCGFVFAPTLGHCACRAETERVLSPGD